MERTHTHIHTQRQSGKNLGAYTKYYVYVMFYSSLCLTSAEPLSPRVKVCGIGLVRFTLMHTHTPMAEPPSIHKRNKPKLQASKAHIHTHTRRVRRTGRRHGPFSLSLSVRFSAPIDSSSSQPFSRRRGPSPFMYYDDDDDFTHSGSPVRLQ